MAHRDKKPRIPSYRLHKPSGQAVVTLSGRDFYLGTHGSMASRQEYERLIAEWLANGRRLPEEGRPSITVDEMLAQFVRWAAEYYPRDSKSSEYENLRYAIRPLRKLYGHTLASEFDAASLKAVRNLLIEQGLARTTVNARIERIKRVFRHALSEGLVPPEVVTSLDSVRGLQRGRSSAREPEPKQPVSWEHVEAVLPRLNADLQSMIRLMWLTGMRVGEVIQMRVEDLDRESLAGDGIWIYRPQRHKTSHHGHERAILLDRDEQSVLEPHLLRVLRGEVFTADRTSKEVARQSGRRLGRRRLLRRYTPDRVRKDIARACKAEGVPHWHPHQLRHAAATRFRAEGGLDYARIRLGQRSLAMADEYAVLDVMKAVGLMRSLRRSA